MKNHLRTYAGIVALLCIVGARFLCAPAHAAASSKEVVLYTALTTTTPQMPLWGAVRQGWPQGRALRAEYWKNIDDLRGVVLAGKGDLWVGDLDGFAQAAMRGAPVVLLAVTGWRKFYFIGPNDAPADMAGIAEKLRSSEQALAVAPQDGPAIGILEETARRGGPSFNLAAMAPQQLMLEALRGAREYALLPEPLASALLAKKPSLRVAANLETEFARLFGGPARLPLVGVAVHADFAKENPELVRGLLTAMQNNAEEFAGDVDKALAVLPEAVLKTLGRSVIAASMERDVILVVPAAAIRNEIKNFLRMTFPSSADARAALDALLDGPFLFPAIDAEGL